MVTVRGLLGFGASMWMAAAGDGGWGGALHLEVPLGQARLSLLRAQLGEGQGVVFGWLVTRCCCWGPGVRH